MTQQKRKLRQTGAANPKVAGMVILAIAVIALGLWFLNRDDAPEPEPVVTEPAEPEPPTVPESVEKAPDIPEPVEEEPVEEPEPAPELPALAQSDEFAREQLGELSGDEDFSLWLQTDNLVQKATAIIDGFSRGNVLHKIIPIQPPVEKFQVNKQDDRIFLDEANYGRYDAVIDTITNIPPAALADAFNALRPLFEEAYGDLGHPEENMDNSLIGAIDVALDTPEITGPIALKRESVFYQVADPDIESLPALQKQLIRVGPENRERIKAYLRRVRSALLQQSVE